MRRLSSQASAGSGEEIKVGDGRLAGAAAAAVAAAVAAAAAAVAVAAVAVAVAGVVDAGERDEVER